MRTTHLMRSAAALAVVALIGVACSGGSQQEPGGDPGPFDEPFTDAQAYPIVASSELVVGSNRLLIGLLNEDDAPIGSPEIDMQVELFDLDEDDREPDGSADMEFVWIEEPFRGLYQGTVEFDSAGRWGAEVTVRGDGLDETLRTPLEVRRDASTPSVGEEVPPSDTPTSSDVKDLSEISTDKNPDPRYYRTSVRDALRANEPFVVVFATPKFCASAACAPMFDNVQVVAEDFPDTTFIHVEPYDLDKLPQELEPVPAAVEWGLPSEPWVFVVDADGRLVSKYEGVLDPAGLRADVRGL